MKIIKLTSENVKKIRAVEITPSGSVVVIGSKKNGAGKSSVLDSILYALGGTRGICDDPLRHGAKKGHATCDLGDIIVKRTFNKSGSTALVVRNNDGTQIGTPQQLLDKITGKIGLDPLAFARMEPGKQVDIFKDLIGLDFSKLDEKKSKLYEERTRVNYDVKKFKALTDIELPKDIPLKPVSMKSLVEELKEASSSNKKISDAQSKCVTLTNEAGNNVETIDKLTFKLADLQERQVSIEKEVAKLNKFLNETMPVKEEVITSKMAKIEVINKKFEVGQQHAEHLINYKKAKMESDKLTEAMADIDAKKEDQLDKADVPVEGITFDEAGIFYKGIPFKQLGSGEQLRISVAMGLAMNPELKVLLIRDGSLLDKDNLKMIAEMAEKADAQVWIERVSEGEECTLIIEDGMIKGSDQEQEKLF